MLTCPQCQTSNHPTAGFCESCGASLEAMRELDDDLERMLLAESRKGAWALGIVAAIQGGLPLVLGFEGDALYGQLVVAGIFAVLAVWALRAPLIASAVGLGLFVLLHGLEAIADPATIFNGILMKLIVIGALVSAVKGGLKHRAFRLERGDA